jgi:sterol desaturase/sphingolipid hydroxylase (fatty acid hydroxylase superfamily)
MAHSPSDPLTAIATILGSMALLAAVETLVPLHAHGRRHHDHLAPNLALTFMTFATNAVFNGALAAGVVALHARGFGLLPLIGLPAWPAAIVAVLALDFSFYAAPVAMHHAPALWRVHRVHHGDPALDVTTTIRQHPAEGVIRRRYRSRRRAVSGPGSGSGERTVTSGSTEAACRACSPASARRAS